MSIIRLVPYGRYQELHHFVAEQAAAIPARNSAEDRIEPHIEAGPAGRT